MGQESDDIVSLPAPPPPNPAVRRAGIDAAMRKFDGIEDAPSARPIRQSPWQWASTHRRATGGLVTAALIAVVGIPAIQVALRNQPQQEAASERAEAPALPTAELQPVEDNVTAAVASPPTAEPGAPVPMAHDEPVKPPAEPALAKEERSLGFAAPSPEQKARAATAAPMLRSPASPMASVVPAPPPPAPPPPPPPPAPMAEREAADAIAAESGNIVVTGSSISRQNTKSAAPTAPARNEDVYASFQGKLQSAFQSNNRNAILALVGYPLRVEFNGDVRTYRNRSDVERDYARIFTSEVRESVLNGQASRYLTFATSPPGSATKIRAVRP